MQSLGVIGGPETFAGHTTGLLRNLYPRLAEPVYFEGSSAMFSALAEGRIDAIVGASATLGEGYTVLPRMVARRGASLFILIEKMLPFNCSLLARKGVELADVRMVYGGPGSLAIAREFIATHMPGASSSVYDEPMGTARRIAEGAQDGAILGTTALARKVSLNVLAENVDGGAINGSWWVVSRYASFEPEPTILFVAGRFTDDCKLGRVVSAVGDQGYALTNVAPYASEGGLLEFDCLLRFRGAGRLKSVQEALADFDEVRLAGAIAA